jgi:hypothetical protein
MTHYRGGAGYACGVGRRWPSSVITSSARTAAVTCGGCQRTKLLAALRTARQAPLAFPTGELK